MAGEAEISDATKNFWARLPGVTKTWQPVLAVAGGVIVGLGGVIGWLAGAWWTMLTHQDEIAAGQEARRIEIQRPFLIKRLDIYFSAIEAARKLTDSNLIPDSPDWKENATRVWELRWGELEMVGDSGTREAARRVTYKMDAVTDAVKEKDAAKDNSKEKFARRELRWAVECLADEMRLSLEKSWGFDPSAVRQSALGENVSLLPVGCMDSGSPLSVPDGMIKITHRSGGE